MQGPDTDDDEPSLWLRIAEALRARPGRTFMTLGAWPVPAGMAVKVADNEPRFLEQAT